MGSFTAPLPPRRRPAEAGARGGRCCPSGAAEEFAALADAPLSAEEREHTLALVRWFTRRYPTPAERLACVRRAYARWTRRARAG